MDPQFLSALAVVLTAAGGVVTDWEGRPLPAATLRSPPDVI